MHRSHGLQGSLKRRYKHPSPTSINGYHTAKSSCRNRLQNGPRSLSRAKVGTHSPFGEESHTTAHTAKQGPSGRGRYHYPRHVLHVHEHPRAGCQNGVLCRFGILAGRCSRRTQKAFGTAMRLCASLFRGAAAPLGCVIFLFLSKLWLVCPALRAFCACEAGAVSLPSARFTCCRNAGRPLVKTVHLPFSEIAKQYSLCGPFFC